MDILLAIFRNYSLQQNAEFWVEPQTLPISTEFLCFHRLVLATTWSYCNHGIVCVWLSRPAVRQERRLGRAATWPRDARAHCRMAHRHSSSVHQSVVLWLVN